MTKFNDLKVLGSIWGAVILILAFGVTGHLIGTCDGKRQGYWKGRDECRKEHQAAWEEDQAKEKKNRKVEELKQQIVFDFETCTVGDMTKAIGITDVKIVRALKRIKHFEVSVCGSGRYWYDCRGFTCRRVRRYNVYGQKIDSYGNRLPEQ